MNKYWNSSEMRTYAPLAAGIYYRPNGVYLVYYSSYYGVIYYDGYGWNFYTQTGGYYDNAPKDADNTVWLIVGIIFTVIFYCIVICVKLGKYTFFQPTEPDSNT